MPPQDTQLTPESKSTASWIGDSGNMMDFIGRILSIKQHHQEQAMGQIQGMLNLSKSGLPIDVKVFEKMVKKAKLPISMKEEDLQAFVSSSQKKAEGQSAGAPPAGGGPSAGGPNPNVPEHAQGLVQAQQKMMSGEKMSSGEVAGHFVNFLAGRARELMNVQGITEQKKAENELKIETLKGQSLQGDNYSRGQLMQNAQLPFNIEQEKWQGMDDKERKQVLEIAAGHESEADRTTRSTKIFDSLITSGRFTDPVMGMKAAMALTSGGDLPQEVKTAMKPFTFGELGEQAKLSSNLIEMGVPPDQVGSVAQRAQMVGLENALPSGMKPLIMQQLALQQKQLSLEGARVGLEGERVGLEGIRFQKELEIAKRAEAAELRKGMTEKAKADLDTFKSLVELKNAGGAIDSELLRGASIKAADALNMKVEEVDTLFHFITSHFGGGTELKFSPRLSDSGKSTVDRFMGGKPKENKPSGIQNIMNAISGRQKEPI